MISPFLTASFMLSASSKYKQGIKSPSALSLILLQVSQKSCLCGSIIPNLYPSSSSKREAGEFSFLTLSLNLNLFDKIAKISSFLTF